MTERTPPGFSEIVGLPLLGAAVIDVLHTRSNELLLFFLPFLIAVIRLFIAQLQLPRNVDRSDRKAARALRACVALNQLAVFILIFFECGAVVASVPDFPPIGYFVVAAFFGIYVALRLWARRFWLVAARSAEAIVAE